MRNLVRLSTAFLLIGLTSFSATRAAADALIPVADRFNSPDSSEAPSFRRHVVPLLARSGCSGRECHGSFQGRGGFQLSLFGSDWDHDFVQLTQTKGGADEIRINAEHPDQSLLLLKPTVQVEHKGKERFKKDSWQYNLVLRWILAGAHNDADKSGELARLDVSPRELLFAEPGDKIQLHVTAVWKDGTTEDVSQVTRFKTNDESIATVAEDGTVTSAGRGDTHIVAFYDSGVVPVPVMLPVSALVGDAFPTVATRTKVDELVIAKLRKMGITPSAVCTDEAFLRRLRLDMTGTLPSPAEVEKFLSNSSPDKRAAKIDELLTTPEYAAWWTTRLCDYTGDSPKTLANGGGNIPNLQAEFAKQWYQWIYKRVAENVPYDRIVADIVLATSRTSPEQSYRDYTATMDSYFRDDHPAEFADHPTLCYYWQRNNANTPGDKALAFAHSFLGLRLECAQCHKHPFDQWTKKDFEQFSAFFAPVSLGARQTASGKSDAEDVSYQALNKTLRDESMEKAKAQEKDFKKVQQVQQKIYRDEIVRRINAGEPVPWNEVWIRPTPPGRQQFKQKAGAKAVVTAQPKILGGPEVDLSTCSDSRQPLMDWLRQPNNPYFARAFVNRVWANYFGRGIVDPPDDLNLANAPSNAELLSYLTHGFIENGFDMHWLHREIVSSDAYQRAFATNETNALDNRNFSHAMLRQLPAEVMLDAIELAVGSEKRQAAYLAAVEERAIGAAGVTTYRKGKNQAGSDTYFLSLFGKPAREVNCDCERTSDPTLLQVLYIRNDPTLLGKLEGNNSWIAELRNSKAAIADIDHLISLAFERTLSRPPTSLEYSDARTDISAAKSPVEGLRDLLWALINAREFRVNH